MSDIEEMDEDIFEQSSSICDDEDDNLSSNIEVDDFVSVDDEQQNGDFNNLLGDKIIDSNVDSDGSVCDEEYNFADYELVNLNFQPTVKLKDSTVIDYDFSVSKMLEDAVPGSWLYKKILTSTPVLATKILLENLHVEELRYCCMDPDPNNIYGEENDNDDGGGDPFNMVKKMAASNSKSKTNVCVIKL
jgi:hypothetical protein